MGVIDALAIGAALLIFAYVVFAIGKKKGAEGGFFKDTDDNDIPDWVDKKIAKIKAKKNKE